MFAVSKKNTKFAIMQTNFDSIIEQRANHVFDVMKQRVSADELSMIKDAFEFARVVPLHSETSLTEWA